jgi:hypothetical protein
MSKMKFPAAGLETTRRGAMARLAVAGLAGVVGPAFGPARAAAATAKLPQSEIGYQASPKGAARCELCANWQAPNACKVVAGQISPNGWCGLFVRRG